MSDNELISGGLAVSTFGTSLAVTEPARQRNEAAKDQKRANDLQRRIQDIKTQREKRKAIREARQARGAIQAGAQASGTSSTSSAATGVGSVGTQLATNLSFLDEVGAKTNQISIFEQKAADRIRKAGEIEAVRDVGIQAYSVFAAGG
jgi:hypothetical protein